MKIAIYVVLILLLLYIGMSSYAIWANRVPLHAEPGFWPRLKVYLSINIAETSASAEFPELRTRRFAMPADQLLSETQTAIESLGWKITQKDPAALEIQAIVSTPLIGFKDDIVIRTETTGEDSSQLYIRSSSRVGRADFGANLGHILRLYTALKITH